MKSHNTGHGIEGLNILTGGGRDRKRARDLIEKRLYCSCVCRLATMKLKQESGGSLDMIPSMHVFVADAVRHSPTKETHMHTGSPSNTAYESMFGTVNIYYGYVADDNGVRH
jgi:hypothetical protein